MIPKLITKLKNLLVHLFGRPLITRIATPVYYFKAFILSRIRIWRQWGRPVYVQIGCGFRPFPQWTNIDIVHGYADILWDVRKSLPFKTESVEAIFCEHVIEHLTKDQGRILLSECFRVLKKNGVARFSTPDAEKYLNSYVNKDDFFTKLPLFQGQQIPRIDIINHVMRENGSHLWIYDEESLRLAFHNAGFIDIYQKSFGDSTLLLMKNLDCIDRRMESLYIEGVK